MQRRSSIASFGNKVKVAVVLATLGFCEEVSAFPGGIAWVRSLNIHYQERFVGGLDLLRNRGLRHELR